jgi:protein-S-isoprenylcysteine O-methyltransferase Ste14
VDRALPVFVVLLEVRLRSEERLMLDEFPRENPGYRRRVPQLVSGLRYVVRASRASRSRSA